MSNLPLQPLVWKAKQERALAIREAQGAGIFYRLTQINGVIVVNWDNQVKGKGDNKSGFNTLVEAMTWVETDHYPHTMQPYVKQDTISDYFDKYTQWGLDRGIIQNGNVLAQGLKLVSEMGELADNLAKGRCIKDDIGDCMVVLNNLAHMTGVTLDECLAQAWSDIKDRKGTMNEHGVFIKDGDVG